jgi:hypothetical protein
MNIIAKVSRIFVVLCFLYSLLKWLFYCNPEDVQSGMNLARRRKEGASEVDCSVFIICSYIILISYTHILGEKCVTYLSLFHSLVVSLLNFAYGVIVSPLLQLFEYLLSPFPKIKYIILAMFSIVLLPLWPLFMIWGSIMFLSDFVIRFHILFYVWDAISFATSNYKYFNSLFKTATQISSTIWNSFRTTKPKPQILRKENIKASKEKLQ